MIVNKHNKTRCRERLSETLKAVFLGSCKAVGHGDSGANPIPFRQEQPGAEFNFPFCRNLHINLQNHVQSPHKPPVVIVAKRTRPKWWRMPWQSDSPKRDSPRQDDFAKRPILSQMAQGFARLAEGIDPLDDRLDFSAHDQRNDVPPCGGDRSG